MSDVDAGRGEAKAIATKQKASQNVGCLNCFYKPFNCIHFYNKDFIIHACMHHSNTVILILHTSLSSNVYWLPCRMSSDTGSILPNPTSFGSPCGRWKQYMKSVVISVFLTSLFLCLGDIIHISTLAFSGHLRSRSYGPCTIEAPLSHEF